MLRKAACEGDLQGVQACRGAPELTHLFFADDNIIYCGAEEKNCRTLANIFSVYEKASGQKINTDKSSVYISPNVQEEKAAVLMNCLGIYKVMREEKYLGLPMTLGKSKSSFFGDIKDRIWKRMQGWKERMLSKAGREVLIKSVAQSIPNYAMSCFMFPGCVLKGIRSIISNFWWGQKKEERKLHWVGWNKMCKPKGLGGLGFRELHSFNLALLAKQGWRLMQNPQSLVARILKAKYYPESRFFEAKAKQNCSFLWRSLVEAQPLLKAGCSWRVGNGHDTKIWKDVWGRKTFDFRPGDVGRELGEEACVDSLINADMGMWNGEAVKANFRKEEVEVIVGMPLSPLLPADRITWNETDSGFFTVKSAYHLNRKSQIREEEQDAQSFWRKIWGTTATPRCKLFIWRVCMNALPVKIGLRKRGFQVEEGCGVCRVEPETTVHVLRDCKRANEVWQLFPFGRINMGPCPSEPAGWIRYIAWILNEKEWSLFVFGIWEIWNQRNALMEDGKYKTAVESKEFISKYAADFKEAQPVDRRSQNQNPNRDMRSVCRWKPPPFGCLKINCDAALDLRAGKAGVGIIIRNHEGKVVECAAMPQNNSNSVQTLETMAILEGMSMAQNCGAVRVIFECDAQKVLTSF